MHLVSPSQSITAVLGGAASPAPTYVSAFHSHAGRSGRNGTLSASAAIVVPAPASGEALAVDFINFYNADNASIVLTVNFVDGADTRVLGAWTLAAGEGLFYVDGEGWKVIDNTGNLKTAQSITPTLADGANLALGTGTGSKIGTGTTQKLGFWNATPIVQPAGAAQAAVTPSTDFDGADTVDKAVVLAAVQAVETLANGIRTALVNAGIIKGAA